MGALLPETLDLSLETVLSQISQLDQRFPGSCMSLCVTMTDTGVKKSPWVFYHYPCCTPGIALLEMLLTFISIQQQVGLSLLDKHIFIISPQILIFHNDWSFFLIIIINWKSNERTAVLCCYMEYQGSSTWGREEIKVAKF